MQQPPNYPPQPPQWQGQQPQPNTGYQQQPSGPHRPPSHQQPFYTYPENYQHTMPGVPPQYQLPPHPPKRYSRTSITLTTLFVVALLLMGSVVSYLNRTSATQIGAWTTTQTFTGTGTTQTTLFTVGSQWKILYACDGTVNDTPVSTGLGVFVYDANANPLDGALNVTCAAGQMTSGETYEYKGGNVYLSIIAAGYWSIQVQEPK